MSQMASHGKLLQNWQIKTFRGSLPGKTRHSIIQHCRSFPGKLVSTPSWLPECSKSKKRAFYYSVSASWQDPVGGGSNEVQEMLVDMVRMQIGRVIVNDLVEESSQNMREIAASSQVDLDLIASKTMDRVDEFSARMLREFDASVSGIERDLRIARLELEASERDMDDFEARIFYNRNEGLFFKNLYPRPKSMKYKKINGRVSSSQQRLPDITVKQIYMPEKNQDMSTGFRTILYSGLFLVMGSFGWSSIAAAAEGASMNSTKFAIYIIIMSALLLQIKFAGVILGEKEKEV